MKNACFVAPIHSPKFDCGIELIKSYNKFFDDDHFYLIFSSSRDMEIFANLAFGLKYRSLVCPETLGVCPITQKKFWGLNYIFTNTPFINCAAIDVDSKFFRYMDYSKQFERVLERKLVYGNWTEYCPLGIIRSPYKFFNRADQEKIFNLTDSGRAYFWFNDIPVYTKHHFLDCMKYINYDSTKESLAWVDFDYIIYAYYLIVKDQLRVKPVIVNNKLYADTLIESQSLHTLEDFTKAFCYCDPMWILKEIDSQYMKNTFMNVHTDR